MLRCNVTRKCREMKASSEPFKDALAYGLLFSKYFAEYCVVALWQMFTSCKSTWNFEWFDGNMAKRHFTKKKSPNLVEFVKRRLKWTGEHGQTRHLYRAHLQYHRAVHRHNYFYYRHILYSLQLNNIAVEISPKVTSKSKIIKQQLPMFSTNLQELCPLQLVFSRTTTLTSFRWANKTKNEQINSISETKGSFDSCL